MKPTFLHFSLLAGLLAIASCSSTPTGPSSTTLAVEKGVPGGVMVDTYKTTATVTGIDATTRKVTVVNRAGKKVVLKCGPEVINFDQIHLGDQLKATVVEEVAVYLAEAGAPPRDGAATTVVLAPKGAKPGGVMVDTVQVTAKVTAINLKRHKATLKFPDGTTKTVAVRPDVDLTQRKVGEEVVIRTTESVAISVERP